jgi:hypothetical protein
MNDNGATSVANFVHSTPATSAKDHSDEEGDSSDSSLSSSTSEEGCIIPRLFDEKDSDDDLNFPVHPAINAANTAISVAAPIYTDTGFDNAFCRLEIREGKGRCVVASTDLAAGALLHHSRAYAHGAMSPLKEKMCHTCWGEALPASKQPLALHCGDCMEVYWCSPRCREARTHGSQAWHVLTKECLILRNLTSLRPKDDEAMLRVTVDTLLRCRITLMPNT